MTIAIKLKTFLRDIDDWLFERFDRNHILFVLTSGAGFACQAPVIHELLKKTGVKICTTTDEERDIDKIDFASENDRQLFEQLYIPFRRALFLKWNLLVNSHSNGFFPKRRALRVYMHHGTAYGNTGTQLPNALQHDVYFGLSVAQKGYFEALSEGIFDSQRAFFAVGSPKTDTLIAKVNDNNQLRDRIGLPNKPTIVITSHWSEFSTLHTFSDEVFRSLADYYSDYNVVQTGHPWLWTKNKNIDNAWASELANRLTMASNEYSNAFFLPNYSAEALFPICDVLVADHSSVITMYSLLDRPIVFFNNLEARKEKFGRSEIIDLYMGASSPFENLDQLIGACDVAVKRPDEKTSGRLALREAFFANVGSSSKVAAEILSQIGGVYSAGSKRWSNIMRRSKEMLATIDK